MKSDQINELAVALIKAQKKIKAATKDTSNPFYKSKYADLHSIWEACREGLNENDLCVIQTTAGTMSSQLVTTLLHSSGQWISGEIPLINQKGDMQGLGSAISYARRYGLAAICGVVTEDDDGNSADNKSSSFSPTPEHTKTYEAKPKPAVTSELVTEAQGKMIYAKCQNAGIKTNKEIMDFLSKTIGVFNTAHVPKSQLDKVLEAISKHSDVPF